MSTEQYLLIVIVAILLTALILTVLLLHRNTKNAEYNLELRNSLTQDFLSFQSMMIKEFDSLSDRTQEKLMQLEERVSSNIIQSHRSNNEVFENIQERMIRIDEAQKNLNELSADIVSLQSILTDKRSRGVFGEVELYTILESAYGVSDEFYEKQYHLPNGTIADAVIKGSENAGLICIDSKFPLENYRRSVDTDLDSTDRALFKKAFRNDVKKHIDDIASKYIIPGVTADCAYMFIPAEAIYAEIYSSYTDLSDYSYRKKVYIVSPTTLMAYLTAIKSIYLGLKKDEKAYEIMKMLSELSVEFDRFNERNEKLYKDFNTLLNDYNSVNVSSNKIIKKFRRINSGEFDNEN
ncbi:MAG: DNA recombination protein RmuC [Erysipelotrichaceae bacterium]|nr:DNA recombination protein RmuC [Erysipelotrichaceae bacterium]